MIKSAWISRIDYKKMLNKDFYHFNSIYYQTIWHELLEKTFKIQVKYIKTFRDNETVLCLTPVCVKRKFFFTLIGSPLSGLNTIYTGPIFIKSLTSIHQKEVFSSFNKLLLSLRPSYIEIGMRNSKFLSNDFTSFVANHNYKYMQYPTLHICLENTEELIWNNFQSRARNMVRKSQNKKVSISEVDINREWLENYYEMLKITFHKQNLEVPHPKNFYLNLIKINNCLKCFTAFSGNKEIAHAIFLIDDRQFLFLSGTANSEGLKFAAPSQIQWSAIKKAKQLGMKNYDFGGIGIKKIDKFKMSFNGKPSHYHRWTYKAFLFSIIFKLALFLNKLKIINIKI